MFLVNMIAYIIIKRDRNSVFYRWYFGDDQNLEKS